MTTVTIGGNAPTDAQRKALADSFHLATFDPATQRPATIPIGATSPFVLTQSAVQVILSSSATAISATGAVSGATAISATVAVSGETALPYVPSGVVQVFMFLASIGGENRLYYARYSSATAFQLYLDAAGTITPTGLAAGAYAGGTSEVTLVEVTIPGGAMGANGSIQIDKQTSCSSTANVKTLREYWGGSFRSIFNWLPARCMLNKAFP